MCGLVGMFGNVTEQDKKALMLLMRFDVTRGFDSTGLAVVHRHVDGIGVHKHVGAPEYLFAADNNFSDRGVYTGITGKVFIGHNRAATKGKVTNANAHPFHHDGVVGAHNGTLTSVSPLTDGDKFEVDSEAIFYNLSMYEAKDVIKDIWGAYALTWYDDALEKVFVIRNSQRPLFWTRRKDKDVVFWASEKWMLETALGKSAISHDEIQEFKVDTLYSFDVSKVDISVMRTTNWEMEEKVYGYTPPPVVRSSNKNVFTSGQGGGRSNVVPFSTKSGSVSDSNHNIAMRKLEGCEIDFRLGEVKRGMGNSEYLLCYPDDPNLDFDIRIYGHNHEKWGTWCTKLHTTTYRGSVKRANHVWVNNREEAYLVIDLRTVREAPEKVVDKDNEARDAKVSEEMDAFYGNLGNYTGKANARDYELYEGYNGRWLTQAEWIKATRRGCAGCGCEADDHDADLVFIDHDDFLCGFNGCVEKHSDYIPQAYR